MMIGAIISLVSAICGVTAVILSVYSYRKAGEAERLFTAAEDDLNRVIRHTKEAGKE
jgi:hypothetical protein